MVDNRVSEGASPDGETGPRASAEPAARLGPTGFDPARIVAPPWWDEFGKISLDPNGEALGLVRGLRAERSRTRFRCAECRQYQRPGSWLVWIETGLRKGDPEWAFEDSAVCRGHWSGTGWCLDCAPKRSAAKATPTRSAKTPKSGLVRRMVARCRQAFAQPSGGDPQ